MPEQAKLFSELELMVVHTANRFLRNEYAHGRLSASSLAKLHEAWTSLNRAPVIEFWYDQLTQRELVMTNLKTIHVHGERYDYIRLCISSIVTFYHNLEYLKQV